MRRRTSPGELMDRITEQVKSIFPVTWDALSNDPVVGDSVLAARVNYAKNFVLGSEPSESEQKDLNALVIEFVAKTAALEIINTAVDFWKEKALSIVTTGTNEQETYANRIDALEKLAKRLLVELAKLEPIVAPLIPVVQERRSSGAPLLSTMEDDLLTPNPQDMGPAYAPKAA